MKSRLPLVVAGVFGLAASQALALPTSSNSAATPSLALSLLDTPAPSATATTIVGVSDGGGRFESIRYRPSQPRWRRPHYYDEGGHLSGFVQLHGGFFNPEEGGLANGAVFGGRFGTSIDDRVQLGVGVDVSHRSDRQSAVIGTGPLPGGGTSTRRIDLSEASSNLLPVQAFVQVSPAGRAGPYVGVSGGYEALFLHATNFQTGEDFDATYDGWGWQFYGGFGFPLSSQARFNVEGFANQGDLDRKVEDSGITYREVVNVNGAGARAGISWSF